jgi:hypothetical protein
MATISKTRTVFHVATRDGKWVVTREGHPDGEFDSFETKDEAIARARTEARKQLRSQVKVHRADGTMDSEFTYGDDPYPPRG